jgi:Domain of unknown function (DUF4157)
MIPPIVHDILKSPGQPLDSAARAFMEPRFNYDFSRVRVHAGPQAAESARAVSAQAYTVGQNVVFDHGRYAPSTIEGKRLLAHELSHVVQQTGASPGADLKIGSDNDPAEHEANETAEHVVSRGVNGSPSKSVGPNPVKLARQKQEKGPVDAGTQADGGNNQSTELTDQDAKNCTPLYLHKLCIYVVGGFNGDRSGVPDDEEWARLNKGCRSESGYDGPDVQISDNEKAMLRNPSCQRGSRGSQSKPPPTTPPPTAPAACPTSIKVAGTGNLQMDASFAEADLLTGFGGFAIMEVSDASGKDWAGSAIHENLKSVKNTCGLAGACSNASGEGGAAGSTFKVGDASNLLGIMPLPSKKNTFYDQHMVIIKGISLLHKAGLPSCEIQCEQTYDCGGKPFGPTFLISYSLKRDTMKSKTKSIDVTSVDMSVAAKP